MKSRARSADQANRDHILSLRVFLGASLGVIIFLIALAFYLARTLTINIPPDLRDGARLDIGTVPTVTVYEFAQVIWQKVHNWHSNGEEDFKANLAAFGNYLTPNCRSTLNVSFERALMKGEVQNRTREITPLPEYPFKQQYVQPQGAGVWNVDLHVNLKEIIRSTPIKDVDIKFPLRVVYYDIDPELNPWSLAIDCYYDSPQPLKDNLLGGAQQ